MAEPILKLTRGVPKNDREWMDVFRNLTKFFRVSGDELIIGGDIALPAQSVGTDELADRSVTDLKLRNSQACSVVGRATNSAGSPTDIQAATNGHYLRRSGDVLSFGAIADADIPATIARDTEVDSAISTAIADHEAEADPHPSYTTAAEVTSAISALNIASGTYTPTLTSILNLDATTAFQCQYLRVGSVVTVSGRFDADPTAASTVSLGISLPIASDFASVGNVGGTVATQELGGVVAPVFANVANNYAQAQWENTDTSSRQYYFTFTYLIL